MFRYFFAVSCLSTWGNGDFTSNVNLPKLGDNVTVNGTLITRDDPMSCYWCSSVKSSDCFKHPNGTASVLINTKVCGENERFCQVNYTLP